MRTFPNDIQQVLTCPLLLIKRLEEQIKKEISMQTEEEIKPNDQPQAHRTRDLVNNFFRDFLKGINERTVSVVFRNWLAPDIEWTCKTTGAYAVGIEHCIDSYNQVLINNFAGLNSAVTFTIHNVIILSTNRIRLTLISSVTAQPNIPPLYEHFYVRVRGEQLSEILITPMSGPPPQRIAIELPAPTICRPCQHNDWDSVRIKNQIALLRCRICTSQWKIKIAQIKKCNRFLEGSCAREKCPFLHINVRKRTRAELEERFSAMCASQSSSVLSDSL